MNSMLRLRSSGSLVLSRHPCRRHPRSLQLRTCALVNASQLLIDARKKYETGDKLAALQLYSDVLKSGSNLTPPQVQQALYGSTAVHASFGDVELAQMTLRDAIGQGLDFEAAMNDRTQYVEIITSQQILIQLRRFSGQLLKAQEISAIKIRAAQKPGASSSGGPGLGRAGGRATDLELQDLLSKPNNESMDIDASVLGIVKRVAILILVGTLLGTGMFFIGLEYLFPKY